MTHHVKHHSREELAKAEIGHTVSTPGVNRFLTLVFLALIVAVPVMQNIREFSAIRAGRDTERRVPQSWDVFTFLWPKLTEIKAAAGAGSIKGVFEAGRASNNRMLRDIGTYEAALKDRDAMIQWLIPRMQSVITGQLKGGNEDAYCGRDGWLFYRRDLDSLTARGFLDPAVLKQRAAAGNELKAPPQPDPVKAIVHFRDQLARRGISLIVMPAPVKPSIYPERHAARYEGRTKAVQNPSFATFMERLARENVCVFDAAPLLFEAKAVSPGTPLYLKTDTHWSPQAMEMTAKQLADLARQTAPLPTTSMKRFTTVEKHVENLGDVALMLKLPASQQVFLPETVKLRQVMDGGYFWRPDPEADVLFLGDSFANIYSLAPMGWGEAAGFVEHLSLALGLPVDSICRNDAGSFATREMLAKELQRGHDRLAGKKLVIWEFAARELACGDWKLIPLTLGEKREVGLYVPAAGKTVEVRGVVRAASPATSSAVIKVRATLKSRSNPPKPGSVPYKDCLIALELDDIETPAGGVLPKQLLAYAWGMRDNVWTSNTRLSVGSKISLELVKWSAVQNQYDRINRIESGNDDALLLDVYWVESMP
jgi:alginate O-acetyltransferase complex protein AlgJ